MMKHKTLGLDLSTSSIGYCLLDKEASVIAIGSVDVSKEESLLEKALLLESELKRFIFNWGDVDVVIEKPLLGFKHGFSQMATVGKLNMLTGIIIARLFSYTSVEPELVSASTIRSALGIKSKPNGKIKEEVISFAASHGIQFETRTVTRGSNKGKVVYVEGVDDAADAYAIAYYKTTRSL